jgi:hypothetical protein
MEQYEALLYFLAGAFSYKLLSYVFDLGKSHEIYNTTIKSCIGALYIADETKKMSQEVKYTLLEERGMPTLELESIKKQDIEITKLWRVIAMNTLFSALPPQVAKRLLFKDWNSAIKIIHKETR